MSDDANTPSVPPVEPEAAYRYVYRIGKRTRDPSVLTVRAMGSALRQDIPVFLKALAVYADTGYLEDHWFLGDDFDGFEDLDHRMDKKFQLEFLGRKDLARHFFVSAGITAQYGVRFAMLAAHWKELDDKAYSYSDMAANMAGIHWACKCLQQGRYVPIRFPSLFGLPDGVQIGAWRKQFKGKRHRDLLKLISARIKKSK